MNLLKTFYAFTILSGIINIYFNLNSLTSPSLFIGILGIIAGVIFYSKNYTFYYLGLIWIFIQIPVLKFGNFALNTEQFIEFNFKINIGNSTLGINYAIVFLLFLKHIILSQYLGKKISVRAFTESAKNVIENKISFTPTDVISSKSVESKIDIEIDGINYERLLFSPEKSERVKKGGVILVSTENPNKLKASVIFEIEE